MLWPFFRFLAVAAVPGTFWAGVELYLLTLGGAQMLFFSIAHTMGLLLVVVLLSTASLVAWLLFSLAALLVPRVARALALPRLAHVAAVAAGATHLALFYWYEEWSDLGPIRIVLCLVGITALCVLFWQAASQRRRAGAVAEAVS